MKPLTKKDILTKLGDSYRAPLADEFLKSTDHNILLDDSGVLSLEDKLVILRVYGHAGAGSVSGNEREVLINRGTSLEITNISYKEYPIADEKSLIKDYINDGASLDEIPSSEELQELRQELLEDWITNTDANPNSISISRYISRDYTSEEYKKASKIMTILVKPIKYK